MDSLEQMHHAYQYAPLPNQLRDYGSKPLYDLYADDDELSAETSANTMAPVPIIDEFREKELQTKPKFSLS